MPSFTSRVALLVSIPVVAAFFACGSDEDASSIGADPSGADGGLADGATKPPPTKAPFGLDTRAANPTCLAGPRPVVNSALALEDAYPSRAAIDQPVGLFKAPGEPGRWYVISKVGTIQRFDDKSDVTTVTPVLDIKDLVGTASEGGLLGLAFHENWAANRVAFVSYTSKKPATANGVDKSIIARIRSTDGGATFDRTTLETLLEVPQPFANHNGGGIAFGPDKMLYIGFGDGGDGNDPGNRGQDMQTLLGKFLRIEVGPTGPYKVPADNPFVGTAGKPEIWALGMRNPWRWSFDRGTGELWAGDVGQDKREEVDIIRKGGNYGWKIREGKACRGEAAGPCEGDGSLIDPVFDYSHKPEFQNQASITGGHVYRGKAIPEMVGTYVFADYVEQRLYWARQDETTGAWAIVSHIDTGDQRLVGFGEDGDGELYGADISTGKIFRVIRGGDGATGPTFPDKLSKTGCFDASDPKKPLPMLVQFDVNSPLWSDGADKTRWFALPDGKTVTTNADGDLDLPVGSVVAKEFRLGGKRIETRLFVRHDDGKWAGYSYEWNDAETDATLVVGGKRKPIGAQVWTYPSGGQCLSCHSEAAGRTLGLELPQLAREAVYEATNRVSPQIDTLVHLGVIDAPATAPQALPDPFGDGAVEGRARSYLHANCSHCHREDGGGRGEFSFFREAAENGVGCDVKPVAGDVGIGANARVIAPGKPGDSVLVKRMTDRSAYGMPPLAASLVHDDAVALMKTWISGTTACKP